jgi:hypothetical protein
MDMFEPQDHPNDFAYPGGPPTPPYDNAGWTLAFQMGIQFDRVLDGFDGPFEHVDGFAAPLPGAVTGSATSSGYLLSHAINDGFTAANRLLAEGEQVYWFTQPLDANGTTYPAGTVFIKTQPSTRSSLEEMAAEFGIDFEGVSSMPGGAALRMNPVRIGLWDRYGGSMPSGWMRWVLEQFEFTYEITYPQDLNEGNLADEYDVLVFVSGAIPQAATGGSQFGRFGRGPDPATIPQEYQRMIGSVTADTTIPQLRQFLDDGGTIVTIGSSTAMAQHLDLPLTNHMVDESGGPLSNDEYFIPGSILQVQVDNTLPIAYGLAERVDVSFNRSPVLRLAAESAGQMVRPVAWFESDSPLRSGWAWGQEKLDGGIAIVEADVGKGKLYLFGPEIVRRSQPHGTYKFLFNAIYLAGAEEEIIH